MKKIGIATVLGVAAGTALATWLGNSDDPAYYAVIAIVTLVFGAVGALFAKKAED